MKVLLAIITVILSFLFGWIVFELVHSAKSDQLVAFGIAFVALMVITGFSEWWFGK